MLFLFSNAVNEIKSLSHSTHWIVLCFISCTTTHLELQSRLALNFCTEQTEICTHDSQVYQAAFSFNMDICVFAW